MRQSPPVAASVESLLTRAVTILIAEIGGGIALALLLEKAGIMMEWALVPVWLVNLSAAWYLAQAAQRLGRNRAFSGLLSALGPPGTLHVFHTLNRVHRATGASA
jgi:hypothetical protein